MGRQPGQNGPRRIGLRNNMNPGFTLTGGPDRSGRLSSATLRHLTSAASEPDLYIDLLLVSRRYAGRRIASTLLDYARTQCRNRGRTLLPRRLLGWGTWSWRHDEWASPDEASGDWPGSFSFNGSSRQQEKVSPVAGKVHWMQKFERREQNSGAAFLRRWIADQVASTSKMDISGGRRARAAASRTNAPEAGTWK